MVWGCWPGGTKGPFEVVVMNSKRYLSALLYFCPATFSSLGAGTEQMGAGFNQGSSSARKKSVEEKKKVHKYMQKNDQNRGSWNRSWDKGRRDSETVALKT